jgi:hypothetical protein
VRGGQDSNLRYACAYNCLAGSPNRPLWHLPRYAFVKGGGSGIRTHGSGDRYFGFQDQRLKPLGHPSELTDLTVPAILAQYLAGGQCVFPSFRLRPGDGQLILKIDEIAGAGVGCCAGGQQDDHLVGRTGPAQTVALPASERLQSPVRLQKPFENIAKCGAVP